MLENYARQICLFQSPRSGKFVSDVQINSRLVGLYFGFNPLDRGNLYQIRSHRWKGSKGVQVELLVSIPQIGEICIRQSLEAVLQLAMQVVSFNPLDRGNLYLIIDENTYEHSTQIAFQSPRSGKFVSDLFTAVTLTKRDKCFNPLDRGNLYQISKIEHTITASIKSFNPLDRGNLYQILLAACV